MWREIIAYFTALVKGMYTRFLTENFVEIDPSPPPPLCLKDSVWLCETLCDSLSLAYGS
jgi:hypothetical protein